MIEERHKEECGPLVSMQPLRLKGRQSCWIVVDVTEANRVSSVADMTWSGSKTTVPASNEET